MRIGSRRFVQYVQGAYVEGAANKDTREYFYFISHEGRLFLDDTKHKNFTSSYKDVPFLNFFYRMLKENRTGEWPDFPWISRCGVERNYVRCDDRPIVYTKLDGDRERLKIGESTLDVEFEPGALSVGSNGRVYHPSRLGLGLVTSRLADQLYPRCRFDAEGRAVEIEWNGRRYGMGRVER